MKRARYRAPKSTPAPAPVVPEYRITDALIGRLVAAGPLRAQVLVADLPGSARARVAGHCYGRAHLRDIGRAIGAMLSDDVLLQHAGEAIGRCLIGEKRRAAARAAAGVPERVAPGRVTLAGRRLTRQVAGSA